MSQIPDPKIDFSDLVTSFNEISHALQQVDKMIDNKVHEIDQAKQVLETKFQELQSIEKAYKNISTKLSLLSRAMAMAALNKHRHATDIKQYYQLQEYLDKQEAGFIVSA